MTASELAHQLHGKRAGTRWQCRCPTALHAHGDRNQSLSVWQSEDGWVRVHCFTGCSREDILAALGLKVRDLALNERPDPKAQALAEKARTAEEYRRKASRRAWHKALEQAIFWRKRREELGKMLYGNPESDKIASLFHAACRRSADASEYELVALGKISWPKGISIKTFNALPI